MENSNYAFDPKKVIKTLKAGHIVSLYFERYLPYDGYGYKLIKSTYVLAHERFTGKVLVTVATKSGYDQPKDTVSRKNLKRFGYDEIADYLYGLESRMGDHLVKEVYGEDSPDLEQGVQVTLTVKEIAHLSAIIADKQIGIRARYNDENYRYDAYYKVLASASDKMLKALPNADK